MIIITNILSILLFISTIVVLIYKTHFFQHNSVSLTQLIFSFILLIIGIILDTYSHLGYGKLFDTYGEYISLLFFPLIIFSIFTFSLNRELEKQRQSELLLQHQNETLIKRNMELDSFVYRVSHDLRAPICTSLGLTDLSIKSVNIDEIKTYLNLQNSSLKRLDQFIIEILDYSKNINSEIVSENINFDQLIDSAFQDYQYLNNRHIQLEKFLVIHSPFWNDKLRLKIVFNNLISNAIKFQKTAFENQETEISIYSNEQLAHIIIRDNGIGIREDQKSEVFKMFFRGSNQTTGSGLGMYIVKDCIQKMNGTIDLKSNLNEGTTIEVKIPNLYSKMNG
jgi:signal transduction histidine kinase